MSDTSQGPGWWQASDGKWYPPEQAPAAAPPPPPAATSFPPPQPAYGPPPQQYAPLPPGYAPPASQGMSGCLKAFLIVLAVSVVLGAVALVIVVVAVDDAVDDFEENRSSEVDDVSDLECDVDVAGDLHATFTVENDSSDRSNYVIEITFEDDGGDQLDTAVAFVNGLESGQRTEGEATTFTDAPSDGGFSCRILEVERFSDENS